MNARTTLIFAGVLGFLAVALGAFGAHLLKATLGENVPTWETASRYQLAHAVALTVIGLLRDEGPWLRRAVLAFVVGTIIFATSLYLVALGVRPMGAVAPIGGLGLMIGWLCLVAHGASKTGSRG